MRIQFDTGPLAGAASSASSAKAAQGTVFDTPSSIIRAYTKDDLPAAFKAVANAQAQGAWLAGYMSYELGMLLDPALQRFARTGDLLPLLEFGVYDAPKPLNEIQNVANVKSDLSPAWTLERYTTAFDRAKAYIEAGDCYQVNLTFPMAVHCDGSARQLYDALRARQPVPFGAFIETDHHTLLSRSPELFFKTDASGRITVRPMKGTVARGADVVQDAAAKAWLMGSQKDQAENLMIVDLLRNDLSRVSEVGSVKVPNLFDIEAYKTVYQMTSTVTAQLLAGTDFYDLCKALFPCGSITGAPKIRAMEIIEELEQAPRGAYCGAIGWIAPDGASEFNVAIRTLVFETGSNIGHLNVGGGLVYDSQAESEYNEALLKAEFARL
ncbi:MULTISPECIES: aminodeoxychorismate synthase component I [Pacificibacter]|uniref:aminodeoxychorismate synthase component I n=1 Tax=Pacificibacter TaxID=1042323 RepID=UPI001C09216C|nr:MULTISPECIES: aminodeoxychorismate synthase component I [Pacificibacter]MBU2937071.1 aminodeoxychorismate synthase component I [Pacificibacter marinus]MDO6616389.1 aminodeoxychorismate synthase component I [Pacificibacter sp. 1_MG-2023]